MSTKNLSVLMNLAFCALLVPAVGNAQTATAQGTSPFPSFIPFSFGQMELPEGVAVDKVGNVYVSIRSQVYLPALADQLWKFSPSGEKSVLVDFGPPGGAGLGLAVDAEGNVYMVRGPKAAPHNGVYRVDQDGNVALMPGTDQIRFPNALAFDQRGTLYVTETASGDDLLGQGGIWRVPKGGTAEPWVHDDLLTGSGPGFFDFPVGANGIAFYRGDLYVINTEKVLVVRVAILPDGSADVPEPWAQVQDVPESMFYQNPYFPLMLDGLGLDVLGNVYVTAISRNAIVRINAHDRSQETPAVFPELRPGYPQVPLDGPVNLAFGTGSGERQNLFITNTGVGGLFMPGLPWPGPGLVKIEVGIPGLPLP